MKFAIIEDRWSSASARRTELKHGDREYTLLMTRYGPYPSGIYPVLQPITAEIIGGTEAGGSLDLRQINDPQEEDHLILVDNRCRAYKLDVQDGTVTLQRVKLKAADPEDITEDQLIEIMDEEE